MIGALDRLTDEELAGRALAGATACFEEIVRRHQAPLMRFLGKRFPSRRDAEDILQDAFVKAWQSLHLYDARFAFRTWMYTIAYRLAVSRGRRQHAEEPLAEYETRSDEGLPGEAAERREEGQSLWRRAREVLSEEQYMALWLHYVDDIPATDIARILNCSWVSVKTTMHRARRKLLPFLQEGGAAAAGSDRGGTARGALAGAESGVPAAGAGAVAESGGGGRGAAREASAADGSAVAGNGVVRAHLQPLSERGSR